MLVSNQISTSTLRGRAEAELVSEVLESKATRKTLCMSLLGIASHRGAALTVTATDASGKSNDTVYVGQLAYNVRKELLRPNLPILSLM